MCQWQPKVYILFLHFAFATVVTCWSADKEHLLRATLFDTTTYHRLVRPGDQTEVDIALNLITINDLNMQEQTLSMTGWLTVSTPYFDVTNFMTGAPSGAGNAYPSTEPDVISGFDRDSCYLLLREGGWTKVVSSITPVVLTAEHIETKEWKDKRLTWNITDGVDHIYALDEEIWKPELFIDNSMTDVSILRDKYLLFKVKYNGVVDWEFPRIFETHCEIDPTYYPYDTQSCAVEVTTWAYTIDEVFLHHLKPYVNIEDLKENGEWIYLSSKLERKNFTEHTATGVLVYSQLVFSVILERRPYFYVINVVLPILLMSFLNMMVFYLPVDSGEKMSYSLTVLLALAVFLTLIADSMPNTSTHTAILSVYLTFTLCMGVICVGISVVVLKISFQGLKSPPYIVQRVTDCILVPFGCWNGCGCCCRCKCRRKSSTESTTQVKPFNENIKEKPKDVKEEDDLDSDSVVDYDLNYTWQEVATILDRFLLVLSLLVTIVGTILFMLVLKIGGALNAYNLSH